MTSHPQMAKQTGYTRGLRAERKAMWFLRLKGYRILAKRFKTPHGEIDIIARRGRTLAFIEVKHRPSYAQAAAAILPRAQKRIANASALYLQRHPQYSNMDKRYDAVMIMPGRWPVHLAGAWTI